LARTTREDNLARRYLVTGGAGFIGSNFIRYLLQHEPEARITNLDALTYAGVPATVAELDESPNHTFVKGDIRDGALVDELMPGHDVVVHFAAESHVDRSIEGPATFLETNVVGTGVVVDAAYRYDVPRFVHVSTDEVYGSMAEGFAAEVDPLDPSSPYSSSKAGSDLLVHSYAVTYGYDVVVTRCTNNYGPYQFPEKVIPLFVTNLLEGKKVPLYGDGRNERDWLYVDDHCAALHLLVDEGETGSIYNIGANEQLSNLDLTRAILDALDRDESSIEYVPDRLGHDLRYAVDSSRLRELGWAPRHDFSERLVDTIEWYRTRDDWWGPLKEIS
jgi:dTDP-glucose 4,6-dehydratase